MTKILLITNKSDVTTDFVVKQLTESNISFYRFNTDEYLSKVSLNFDFANNNFTLFDINNKIKIDLLKISSVYYRRPTIPEIFTNSDLSIGENKFILNEITYVFEGLYKILRNAFWISPVYSIREAENKIFQLQLAKSLGFKIPKSLITNEVENAKRFNIDNNNIIKPIKTGLIDDIIGDKIILTSKVKNNTELERVKACPTYFQSFIDKVGDIRVTVVGEIVFPAFIESQEYTETQIDWRASENLKLKYKKTKLPKNISKLCVNLTKKLGLNFSAIDLVLDKNGNYYFLEINPNGQWAWIEKQLGYNISQEITNLLNQ